MKVGIGLKCPHGHFKVQAMVGEPRCPQCGTKLVPDEDAPNSAMNRYCEHCKLSIGFNVFDNGNCPECGRPWST